MPRVKLPHATNPRVGGARSGGRTGEKRTKQVLIRLSEDEFAEISAAASSVDDALANWARRVLLAAARELNRQATEP